MLCPQSSGATVSALPSRESNAFAQVLRQITNEEVTDCHHASKYCLFGRLAKSFSSPHAIHCLASRRLLRGADCSACTEDHSGPWLADPVSILPISEPRKRLRRDASLRVKAQHRRRCVGPYWAFKPAFQSEEGRSCLLLATEPSAACEIGQFWVL